MKKVILKLYDLVLADILEGDGILVKHNQESINKAQRLYPLNMREYRPGLSGYVLPLETIFNAFNRNDIIKEANIKENDSVFEKLYKVAGLDIEPINGFYIVKE